MTLATLLVVAISGIPSPSVYWSSSPTYGNETLLVAGAGFDSSGTSVEICQGKDYEDSHTWMGIVGSTGCVASPAAVWEQSVQVLLPPPSHCTSIRENNNTGFGSWNHQRQWQRCLCGNKCSRYLVGDFRKSWRNGAR